MSPQIVYPNIGKVTFVAFIWLFSTVWFQMFTQITWIRIGEVTLIAFLFARIELKSHSLHLFDFSPLCDFNCYSNNWDQNRQSHIDCIFFTFTVYFQMSPLIVYPKRYKVTFVAFIWLFPTVWFQMCSQITWIRIGKVPFITFFTFLHRAFSNVSSNFLPE